MQITTYAGEFYRGYVTAILWANTVGFGGEPLEAGSGEFNPAPLIPLLTDDAECAMFADAVAFIVEEWDSLKDLPATPDQSGHDFALTRNGHGAGFWDRGYGPVGESLSHAARDHGEFTLLHDGTSIDVL